MPGRGAGTAGLAGSGLGVGSCEELGSDSGARLAGGFCAALGGLRAGFRAGSLDFFAAFEAGLCAGSRARAAWARARAGFFDGPLEELTPELSDLPDCVW